MKFILRYGFLAALGAILIAAAGCGTNAADNSSNQPVPDNAQIVNVESSNFKFVLDKTELQAGTPVVFEINDKEGNHSFSIASANISKNLSPGTQKVIWNQPKAGTYTIRCTVFCGSGHSNMVATFNVK
ncbi:MAG: hypothetical protein JWN30_1860 [Bacilli bacterium]|nr:hypothetical protein [Bacilli bacterium]